MGRYRLHICPIPTEGGARTLSVNTLDESVTLTIDGNTEISGSNTGDDAGRSESTHAYGDATPLAVVEVPADKVIESVTLVVTEAFDGAGAALTIGDVGDPDRLMTAAQNDPATVGTYTVHPGVSFGSATQILLSITPGAGASQGAFLVVITYQQ